MPRAPRLSFAVLVLPLVCTSWGSAQLCSGNASLTRGRVDFAFSAGIDKLAELYNVEVRLGLGRGGAFAALERGIKTWNLTNLAGESGEAGVRVGLQFPRPGASRFGVCPLLAWTSVWGPERFNGTPYTFAEQAYSAGVTVGYALVRTRTWDVIPAATLTVGSSDPKMTAPGGSLAQYQNFCCGRRSFSTAWLGLGLGFARDVTLLPSITIPLSVAGETTYGARVVIRLGNQR